MAGQVNLVVATTKQKVHMIQTSKLTAAAAAVFVGLAAFQARLMSILPSPPLTPDQVELLKSDNIVSSGTMTLASLEIAPTPVEVILPTYLDRFRRGGWYERRSRA